MKSLWGKLKSLIEGQKETEMSFYYSWIKKLNNTKIIFSKN